MKKEIEIKNKKFGVDKGVDLQVEGVWWEGVRLGRSGGRKPRIERALTVLYN